MRKTILYIACSLDGKIAGKDHDLDWLPPAEDDKYDYGYEEMYNTVDVLVMGYKTYEVCAGFGEWPYKGKTSYIFTRDANKTCIPGAEIVTQDPVSFIQQLKAQEGKNIWLIGGGNIIQQLHDAALIDEYIISIVPVILGEGIEMFPELHKRTKLKLTKNKTYENGLTMLYYETAAT